MRLSRTAWDAASPTDRRELVLQRKLELLRAQQRIGAPAYNVAVEPEAAAADPYAALDLAAGKLEARMRKQHDKRHTRRGNGRIPASDVAVTVPNAARINGHGEMIAAQRTSEAVPTTRMGPLEIQGEGPLVVRETTHAADPMTHDQALSELELVGHDF